LPSVALDKGFAGKEPESSSETKEASPKAVLKHMFEKKNSSQ